MEIVSGLVVVVVFLMLVAIAAGWCGERYEKRENKEVAVFECKQKEFIEKLESMTLDEMKKRYGNWIGEKE